MENSDAATIADKFIAALISSQPSFWPTGSLTNAANAQASATNLATFRQKLIEELAKQRD
jgi:hypothetical protein